MIEEQTAFPVGSRWMCRLFVTTGPWKEVEVLETDVQRKYGPRHRVRLVESPSAARFFVQVKYLQPIDRNKIK